MNRVKSGELKHRIEIVRKETAIDDYGIVQDDVEVVRYIRKAKINNSSYRKMELLVAEGVTGFNSLDFIFRYADIDKVKDFIRYKGKLYDIKSAIDLYNDGTFILATGVAIDG